MASRYLLDTDTAGSVIKGNVPAVRSRLEKIPMAQIAVSSVTEAELRHGADRLPGAKRLHAIVDEFLLRVTILPWDSEAARQYGRLRASLEREGRPMGNIDTMIGAQALASELVLVTNDRAFGRIKKLRIEDWTKA